ncbi:MAG: tetratricopeptide repeat protein [Planctomycetaceae bacterium]|nr:tetratricopeptide repeat protein [Planctomycetaceae bacterium]
MAEVPEEDSGSEETVVEVTQPTDGLGFYPMLSLSLALGIGLPWGVWLVVKEPAKSPRELSQQVVEMLDSGRTKAAYLKSMKLLKSQLKDPDIGGSLEYVVGISYFRKAEKVIKDSPIMNRSIASQSFDLARRYLEQANLKSLDSELRPQWSYALGACYFYLGRLYDARSELELAYLQSEEYKSQTMLMLGECYLDPNVLKASLLVENDLDQAREKRTEVIGRLEAIVDPDLEKQSLTPDEIGQGLMYIADLSRQNKELDKAESILKTIQEMIDSELFTSQMKIALTDNLQILLARIALDRGNPARSREILQSLVAKKSGLQQRATMQGHFVVGLSYSMEKNIDQALDHLEKPALDTQSEVCFPANLYAADLARKKGLHEEALVYYLRALALVQSTDSFTNRWINLKEARLLVQAASTQWRKSDRYEHFRFSVILAEHMVPLFTEEDANVLSALASKQRAELVQKELDDAGNQNDPQAKRNVLEHWKRAGHAYARLANSFRASGKYGETLWEAAILYRRGKDFKNALLMIRKYIATNPRVGLPQAMIMRARTMMDVDLLTEESNIDEVIVLLEKLIKKYPKDQAVYDAQLLLGQAYLEQDQTEKAISIWSSLINESPLSPIATEWQSALFELGQALFNTSDTRPVILIDKLAELSGDEIEVGIDHYEQVEQAIRGLDQFVTRVPDHARSLEARWLLAKGLQYRAGRPVALLKSAETENTRNELLKEIRSLMSRSIVQYNILSEKLAVEKLKDQLDDISLQFMRDAYFEPAHIQYNLAVYDPTMEGYRKAIETYSSAAYQFSGDPIVLIAYFRIAECYRQLGAEDEARRQLEQARVILNQLEEPFSESFTSFNKQQWGKLLKQYLDLYDLALDIKPAAL